MKKLFYLFCLLSVISFIGCSNDDEPEVKKFSPDVENVLTSIQGTFSGEEYFLEQWFRTDKLTFSPFAAPVEKTTFKDGTVEVHGTVHRVQNKAVFIFSSREQIRFINFSERGTLPVTI